MSLQLGRSLYSTGPRSVTRVLEQHGSWDQFAEILRSFPSVHTLQLHLHALDILQTEMDEDQLAVVRQYASLRRLTFCAYIFPGQDALNQLIASWPRLESLELDGPFEQLFFDLAPEPQPATALAHLRKLVLRVEVGEDAQEWLRVTFAGAPQLRTLRCSVADVRTFIDLLHGTLEDLTVDFTDGAMFEHVDLAGLAQCGALHTLMLTDDTLATSALQCFPTTLRHVSLLVDPQSLLRTNLNWSTVKSITVAWPLGMRDPNADEGTAQKGYKNLREKCSKHGVEFTLLEEVPDSWTT